MSRSTEPTLHSTSVDVIVVGAGLAGVGAAWRLRQRLPDLEFVILEARDRIGGTWDLFRYPGVRSDSDMHSFSYPFRPWTERELFASGDQIREYIAAAAAECGAEDKITYGCRVTAASWSSETSSWTVEAQTAEGEKRYTCRFLYLCTGYYDYDTSYQPDFPGRDEFRGSFVVPQFWPHDLDCSDSDVVVIGSGATAITLAPALAQAGARVTLLQRSPSYVASLPSVGKPTWTDRWLPRRAAYRVRRLRSIVGQQLFFEYSRRRPDRAADFLRGIAARKIGWPMVEEHFTPRYRPWDQRLCVAPDGDLFRAIKSGAVTMVTDEIDRFTADGIRLRSGQELRADVVVSATGLVLRAVGGIAVHVDGRRIHPGQTMTYRGMMLDGVPNLVYTLGYVNSSWTLRSDLIARRVCRLLRHMRRRGFASATPTATSVEPVEGAFPLSSGYVRRSPTLLPRLGSREPWRIHQNYPMESIRFWLTPLGEDMAFARAPGTRLARFDPVATTGRR
jgi:monooxygenase